VGRKKVWSKDPAKTRAKNKAAKLRAGKRKCFRCKEVYYKERGNTGTICERCKTHCSRCDEVLCEETLPKVQTKNAHQCSNCKNASALIANRNRNEQRRDWHLVRNYGITLNEYEAILKIQKGACWICQKPPKKEGNRLAVDHLHSKGEKKRNPRERRGRVRGLLCWSCNSGIAGFGDDIIRLRRAADYLEAWPAQRILNKEKTDGNS
jgi:hypothetical protein